MAIGHVMKMFGLQFLLMISTPLCGVADVHDVFKQLQDCAGQLQDRLPEDATLAVATLFLNYSQADLNNTLLIAASVAAFNRRSTPNDDDVAAAKRVPQIELNGTIQVLNAAVVECQRVKNGGYRIKSRPYPTNISFNKQTSFFQDSDGMPYFPTGFSQQPDVGPHTSKISQPLAMNFAVGYFTPASILGPTCCKPSNNWSVAALVANLDATHAIGATTSMLIGNGKQGSSSAFPPWADTLYPNLTTNAGTTHFYSYDIDNPGAKALMQMALEVVVPVVARHPAVLGWSLANEPGFASANSSYTLAKFQLFLRQRYNNSDDAFATAWGRRFPNSFADATLVQYMGLLRSSDRGWLDWMTFNNERVSAWYAWLCGTIHGLYPADVSPRPCLIKASNSASGLHPETTHGGDSGIDRLANAKSLKLRGCDTRITPTSDPHFHTTLPSFPSNVYAIDLLTTTAGYDLMRSLGNFTQPVMETEWHSISTVGFRREIINPWHLRGARMLAHIHGMAANIIWFWGRDEWSTSPKMSHEFAGADFYASLSTQPLVFHEYVRGSVEANSLAPYLIAMANTAPAINILYSQESLSMDDTHIDNLYCSYSLLHSLGVPIAFVPTTATLSFDHTVPLLITGASYVALEVQRALQQAHVDGAQIVTTGNTTGLFAFDERGAAGSAELRKWALSLPHLEMNVADNKTFHMWDNMLASSLHRTVRCVESESTSNSTVFGSLCRYVEETKTMFVMNMVNTTLSIDIDSTSRMFKDVTTGESVEFPMLFEPLQVGFYTIM